MKPVSVLIFGDVVGKLGRRAVVRVLPELRKAHAADLVIANAENLAHGKGVTRKTLGELMDAGVDIFTSGDHIWDRQEAEILLKESAIPLLRPANYPPGAPGTGVRITRVGAWQIAVLNLQGRVFMRHDVDDPFRTFDALMASPEVRQADAVLVDFHAEATSEKAALGHYARGRAQLFWGTHTHIPTADARIFPEGMGYVSDVGMAGGKETVIGVDKDTIVNAFLSQRPAQHTFPEEGEASVFAIHATLDCGGKRTLKLTRVDQDVII